MPYILVNTGKCTRSVNYLLRLYILFIEARFQLFNKIISRLLRKLTFIIFKRILHLT